MRTVAGRSNRMERSVMFVGPLAIEPHVASGKPRALATADRKRSAVLPEAPTVAEAGYAGVESGTWYGFAAPPVEE